MALLLRRRHPERSEGSLCTLETRFALQLERAEADMERVSCTLMSITPR